MRVEETPEEEEDESSDIVEKSIRPEVRRYLIPSPPLLRWRGRDPDDLPSSTFRGITFECIYDTRYVAEVLSGRQCLSPLNGFPGVTPSPVRP